MRVLPQTMMSRLLVDCLRMAERSDCTKIKFGAVALDDKLEPIGYGWNHNPMPDAAWSCASDCVGGIRKGVRSGTCVERCYALHAEQHALLQASAPVYEIAVAGLLPDGTLFDNGGGFYCTVCARLMASAGVRVVSIWAGGEQKRLLIADVWEQSYRAATA